LAVTDVMLTLQGSWWVRDDTSDEARRWTLPEMVGDVLRDADQLKAVSPVERVADIRAPLFLAFGERDLRVPLAHGERLREALRKAGREPEWVLYADEAHGWRNPRNQLDFARRLETFLSRYLSSPADAAVAQPRR
jgi:dipeptidyl aminopeptidase/acylaminoacyl peptidase